MVKKHCWNNSINTKFLIIYDFINVDGANIHDGHVNDNNDDDYYNNKNTTATSNTHWSVTFSTIIIIILQQIINSAQGICYSSEILTWLIYTKL